MVAPAVRIDERGDEWMRRVGEADAMSEVVTSVSKELDITDNTEQLLLYLLARIVVTLDTVDWNTVVLETGKRVLASFVTHHLMNWLLQSPVHSSIGVHHLTQH